MFAAVLHFWKPQQLINARNKLGVVLSSGPEFHFAQRGLWEQPQRFVSLSLNGKFRRPYMNSDRVAKYLPETLSIVRIVVALLFLEHGSAKLLGFPPPPNGAPAAMTLLWLQGAIELVGGVLLAAGLFTRPVAFILSGNMAVAYFMAHAAKSFFPVLNGGDSAILYCFVFLLFFVAGPGRWSVDSELIDTYGSGDRFGDNYGHRTARTTGGRS
jgi:putative oxidoreductase